MRFLNSRQKKDVVDGLAERYGFSGELEGHMVTSNKEKLYLVSDNPIIRSGLDKSLRVERAGVHIGTFSQGGLRLSVEGSQLVGPFAHKNILEIVPEHLEPWVRGEDLPVPGASGQGLQLVKFERDFLGSGVLKSGVLQNNLPKIRRVKNLNR